MKDISVLIFEDNDDLRESLRLLINGTPGYEVKATFPNGAKANQAVTEHQPDVVLMDFDMPEVNGIQALQAIKQSRPETHVVMLTIFDQNEHVFEAMCSGANGYLLKRAAPTEIIKAIDDVMTGGAPMTPAIAKKVLSFFAQQKTVKPNSELTPKESEVLKWLVDGYSYKMIATELEVSLDTIRTHIKNIYRKLQVNSMTEAVAKAIRQNLV
jgi:DNA-binding NarL/FixJ family response regulator